jgi:excisionase family DNA binding protein
MNEVFDGQPLSVLQPLAVSPRQACGLLSIGLTRLYELLGSGELDSFLVGRSRRITVASMQAFVERRLAANGVKSQSAGLAGVGSASDLGR